MSLALIGRLFPGELHHMDGFQRQVRRLVPDEGKLLDLGCGANLDLAELRTRRREVWGTDFQAHPHLQHREWFRLLPADGKLPFADATFDLVASIWVLEHVAQPDQFLREVARVLRPGGKFVAHTISGSHYVTWLRRLIGLLPHRFNQWLVRRLYGRACHDTFPAYYRLNRIGQMRRAGQNADLDLLQVDRYEDPGYFRFCQPLQKLAILADWLMEHIAAGWGRIYLTATWQKRRPALTRYRVTIPQSDRIAMPNRAAAPAESMGQAKILTKFP